VEIANGAHAQTKSFAIDAVSGTLDLYSLDEGALNCVDLATRNHLPVGITTAGAEFALIDKVRRIVFRTGFFALRKVRISAAFVTTIHVPYWVVMKGSERDLKLRVFDAVRCRPEGSKVRTLLQQWLAGT
jgi:hypothetical protein